MNLLAPIDAVIDRITMYRLVIYYLVLLLLAAMGLNLFGAIGISWWSVLISTTILVLACWGLNKAFGRLFRAPINNESPLITAGILALIITPQMTTLGIIFLLAASVLATASKYIVAINRRHLFNPAAFAVLLTGLAANQTPTWWVGSAAMLPFVLFGGLLIVRKVRRVSMIVVFLTVTSFVTAALAHIGGGDPMIALRNMTLSSAVFFLAFVMLTEPVTSPATRGRQLIYAGLVGALMPPQVHIFSLYTSPELALIIGNMFNFVVSRRPRLLPVFKQKLQLAANTVEFVFVPDRKLAYEPGQYIELTLPHAHKDSRGERRYFTLASSPTEPELKIGAKFYNPSSSFKRAMLAMTKESRLAIGQLAGDFTLPKNQRQKLAFIAGGIGVTPFRSMTKYLIDTNQQRDVVMLFSARTAADVAYSSLFEQARQSVGMKTTYILDGEPATAKRPNTYAGVRITPELIAKEIPDYRERLFYISGTHPMVTTVKQVLRKLGVPRRRIKVDFFPGYA